MQELLGIRLTITPSANGVRTVMGLQIKLAEQPGPTGPVWWPAAPEPLLAALYGDDWRTPQPEWDSLVSNRSLQDLNLSWRCWALKSLCQCWLGGDLARTTRFYAEGRFDSINARLPTLRTARARRKAR